MALFLLAVAPPRPAVAVVGTAVEPVGKTQSETASDPGPTALKIEAFSGGHESLHLGVEDVVGIEGEGTFFLEQKFTDPELANVDGPV